MTQTSVTVARRIDAAPRFAPCPRPAPALLLVCVLLLGPACLPPGGVLSSERDAPWRGGVFETGPYLVHLAGSRFAVVVGGGPALRPVFEWWPEPGDGNALLEKPGPVARRPTPDEGNTLGDRSGPGERSAPTVVPAQRQAGLWVAVLDGPRPGQRIAYRVRGRGRTAGPYVFVAGRPPGARFRFAVFGDTRTGHVVHWAVIQALARERIDFAIHTGDMVDFGVQEKEWRRFLAIERPLMARAPLYPVMGNHDRSRLGYFQEIFLSERVNEGRRYYSQDWGSLRLVVLDGEDEYREGSAQHRFAVERLAEAARLGMHIVMAVHEPPFASGAEHGSNLSIRRALHPLARRFGVALVFCGHNHNYERTRPIDGVTYVITGSAGAPIHPVSPQNFTRAMRLEPHYVLVDVAEHELSLRAINLRGHTFDAHVIRRPAPRRTEGGAR